MKKKKLFDKKTIALIIIACTIGFGFYILNILSMSQDNIEEKDKAYSNLKDKILE